MFKNYLTIAIRNLARHKVYSFINIAGLAIGMACCALIMLYVQHELSYDTCHSKGDRTYRILRQVDAKEGRTFKPSVSGPFAPEFLKDLPEVETVARVAGYISTFWAKYQNKPFFHNTGTFLCADPEFFSVFDFPFVAGDLNTALKDPFSMVITEKMAHRYFGSEDPLGKVISLEIDILPGDYKVTGVVRRPENSSMTFDMIASSNTPMLEPWFQRVWQTWRPSYYINPVQTYVVLHKETDIETLEAKLFTFAEQYMDEDARKQLTYTFQPLTRMYLHTTADYGQLGYEARNANYGNMQHVYLFSGIACLIMLIACVNFMNLSTARSANRAKEVGMRKASGAYRFQLIRQFLGEAVLLSGIAFVLAAGLVELAAAPFNAFVGTDVFSQVNGRHYLIIPVLIAFVGLVAGSYPAFFLSAFDPISVLKGSLNLGLKGALLKKGLVVFQFSVSILLIICTITIYRQLNDMQTRDLGFDKELMIQMPIFEIDRRKKTDPKTFLNQRYQTVKQAFESHPNVLRSTAYRQSMGSGHAAREVKTEDGTQYQVYTKMIDEDFLSVYNIDLIAGRTFSGNANMNEEGFIWGEKGILVNETAVKKLGLADPIGKSIDFGLGDAYVFPILGVVKDFHYQSLHEEIAPLMLGNSWRVLDNLGVKVRPNNLPETLAFLEKTWQQFLPDRPFEFEFVDENLNNLYLEDQKVGQLVGTFAGLAILVACLGLFGLAAFTAEQRTKEIGVRKVLGASVWSIIFLIAKEFAKLVLMANVIIWPIAYFAVDDWLQNFAYRVDIAWWVFALAGVTTLLIALGTVGYQALRAALSNPIEALRYE